MILSSVVLPHPLGPTIAANSPSSTVTETSSSASTSRLSRSCQYRLVRQSTSSFSIAVGQTIVFCRLPLAARGRRLKSDRPPYYSFSERELRLALLFRLNLRPKKLLKKSF